MQEDDFMSDFPFEFSVTSPANKLKSERQYSSKSRDDSSSEDEFDLECRPTKRVKKDKTVSDAGQIAETTELSSKAPADENDDPDVVGGGGIGGGGSPSEKDSRGKAQDGGDEQRSGPAKSKTAGRPPWTPEHFSKYPLLMAQRRDRWNNISAEQLVWYQSFPALVVPPSMYMVVPSEASAKPGDKLMYGPCPKHERPTPDTRYVILQYLPLVVDHNNPSCPYAIARKSNVEKVVPYNAKVGAAGNVKLGPASVWADAPERFRMLKNTRQCKAMRRENFDIAMAWAQEFLERALELDARRAKISETLQEDALTEAVRIAQEREQQQQQQREGEQKEDKEEEDDDEEEEHERVAPGGDQIETSVGGKNHGKDSSPSGQAMKSRKPSLRPGDKIFYWHQTSIAGTKSARREAVVVQVRSRQEAKETGLQLVLLDNQETLLDETVIQKFRKDKETGEWTKELDESRGQVKHHRLTPGRLEGVDAFRDRHMEVAMDTLREKVTSCGAGQFLLDSPNRPKGERDPVTPASCRLDRRMGKDGRTQNSGVKRPRAKQQDDDGGAAKAARESDASRTPDSTSKGGAKARRTPQKPKASKAREAGAVAGMERSAGEGGDSRRSRLARDEQDGGGVGRPRREPDSGNEGESPLGSDGHASPTKRDDRKQQKGHKRKRETLESKPGDRRSGTPRGPKGSDGVERSPVSPSSARKERRDSMKSKRQ